MSAAWGFLAAALVAAVTAQYDSYDPVAELDAYPELQRGLFMYRRHHRGGHHHHHGYPALHHLRHHHKMALTHHRAAPRLDWNPEDDAEKKPILPPMALPGRHPSVEKALDGMGGDLQDLKEKQRVAKETRGELEGKVDEVTRHMNDAMSIKHAIVKKEAQLRMEQNKLRSLEREASHIEETHSSLVNSLHRVLEPKLQFARERLEKKEVILQREEQATTGWKEKKDQIHQHALELLKEKKVLHESLLQAEHDATEAKKREEVARRRYDDERKATGQEVQSFRYAETRYKAEAAHAKAAEQAELAAKESVNKLGHVLEAESEKVEESMEVNRNRIRLKMQEISAQRETGVGELENLKQRYREWQDNQRARAAEVVRKGEDTAIAAEAYADRQKQVLDTAQAKVVHDAVAKSDWAWDGGSGFSKDGPEDAGFTDSNPSFSD